MESSRLPSKSIKFTENDAVSEKGVKPPSTRSKGSITRNKKKSVRKTRKSIPKIASSTEEENEPRPESDPMPCDGYDCRAMDGPMDMEIPKVLLSSTGSALELPKTASHIQRSRKEDFALATIESLSPPILHPITGDPSTDGKRKEHAVFLRNSGFLKLFGKCILNTYRMRRWPPTETLLEQMLNAMGYVLPDRKKIIELTAIKESLEATLDEKREDNIILLEQLDSFEDSAGIHDLLDQDEVLPPIPCDTCINRTFLDYCFNCRILGDNRDEESSDLLYSNYLRSYDIPKKMYAPDL